MGETALRIVIAALLFYMGAMKFSDAPRSLWVHIFELIGWGQWFRYATAIIEIVGAVLLVIPRATLFGAALLACTMVGALLTHIFVLGLQPASVLVVLLLASLSWIGYRAWGRRRIVRKVTE